MGTRPLIELLRYPILPGFVEDDLEFVERETFVLVVAASIIPVGFLAEGDDLLHLVEETFAGVQPGFRDEAGLAV